MPGAPRRTSTLVPPAPDLADMLAVGGTAVLLDVEPTLGARMAADANHRGLAHAVLVLPRWPHSQAVLPTDELVGTLEAAASQLKPAGTSNVIFVLDAERQRSLQRRTPDRRIDNRYAVAVSELPDLATLRAAGIQRVVRVVHSR
jgi:hypothetical protein